MRIDNPNDYAAEVRELRRRVRQLETASPLRNASLGSGGITILTPGETPDGGGVELYKLGHGSGTKRGFLFKDGNDWKTLEVYIDERVNAGTAQPNARLTDIEGRMTSAEAGITYTANRTTDLEGRMSNAEGGLTYTGNRVGDLEGRMSNAESSLNNKASTSSVTAVQTQANNTATELGQLKVVVAQIKDRYNDHIDAGHPGFPKVTA